MATKIEIKALRERTYRIRLLARSYTTDPAIDLMLGLAEELEAEADTLDGLAAHRVGG